MSIRIKIFVYFAKKKNFILHIYFYKTPIFICLFYTFFYLNNIFLTFFYYFTPTHGPPTLTHLPSSFSLNTFPFSFSFFILFSSFSFSSSSSSSSSFFFFFFFIILSIHISPSSLNQSSSIYRPHQPNPVKGRGLNQYQNKTHTFYHQFNKPTKFFKLEH